MQLGIYDFQNFQGFCSWPSEEVFLSKLSKLNNLINQELRDAIQLIHQAIIHYSILSNLFILVGFVVDSAYPIQYIWNTFTQRPELFIHTSEKSNVACAKWEETREPGGNPCISHGENMPNFRQTRTGGSGAVRRQWWLLFWATWLSGSTSVFSRSAKLHSYRSLTSRLPLLLHTWSSIIERVRLPARTKWLPDLRVACSAQDNLAHCGFF